MASKLPRLRSDLDIMPSPVPDRPGMLMRDSMRYTDAVLIIPPALFPAMTCFDGEKTAEDLREILGDAADPLFDILQQNGFLEDAVYHKLREAKCAEFAASPFRFAVHAGSAYLDDGDDLKAQLLARVPKLPPVTPPAIAIAAPHISPEGGWTSYGAAYGSLDDDLHREKTFIILGTSHYGEPDRFGLTRKPFVTPFGATTVASDLIDELAAQPAVMMEDYCHAVEHSIEFQVVFLQWMFGAHVRVLPILCGAYARSIYKGGKPEANDQVARFLGALGEINARENNLLWVLGIDMAHMGRRYGDRFSAAAHAGQMAEVAARDQDRIARINDGDAAGFWERVQQNRDDLKWCGASPLYTFLKAVPEARGTLRHYEQWNIDADSVVSFAGMAFHGS